MSDNEIHRPRLLSHSFAFYISPFLFSPSSPSPQPPTMVHWYRVHYALCIMHRVLLLHLFDPWVDVDVVVVFDDVVVYVEKGASMHTEVDHRALRCASCFYKFMDIRNRVHSSFDIIRESSVKFWVTSREKRFEVKANIYRDWKSLKCAFAWTVVMRIVCVI